MARLKENRLLQQFLRVFVAAFACVLLEEASAGTGYVDTTTGKWYFSVVFVQPSSGDTIKVSDWLDVFRTADTLLYKATAGKHQFGKIIYARKTIDPTADIVVGRVGRSRSDLPGVRWPGHHIFLSDSLRTPGAWTRANLAKMVLHELGHYFYFLLDEYRNAAGVLLQGRQCIFRNVSTTPTDTVTCFMETIKRSPTRYPRQTWCYIANHEIGPGRGNPEHFDTWQAQHNDSLSCWEKMQQVYRAAFNTLPAPPEPASVNLAGLQPLLLEQRQQGINLVVALNANIWSSPPQLMRTYEILERLIAQDPGHNSTIRFILFSGTNFEDSGALQWNNPSLLSTYRITLFAKCRRLAGLPGGLTQVDLNTVLQTVSTVFAGAGTAASLVFMMLTNGNDDPTSFNSAATWIPNYSSQNIRSSIGKLVSNTPGAAATYQQIATAIDAVVYDVSLPPVRAYQTAEATDKQLISVKTLTLSAGTDTTMTLDIVSEADSVMIAFSWPDTLCAPLQVVVGREEPPTLIDDGPDDVVGQVLKARRYRKSISSAHKYIITLRVPTNCFDYPVPVTCSVVDENPNVSLSATPGRPLFGYLLDNEIAFAGVTAEGYRVVKYATLIGDVDSLGNFRGGQFDMSDDGVEGFGTPSFQGDWVASDGIFAKKMVKNPGLPEFRTARIEVRSSSSTTYAAGEIFSNADTVGPVPPFQRTAFVTLLRDLGMPTNLKLAPLQIDSTLGAVFDSLGNRIDSLRRVTGRFGLPSNFPHAFRISGNANGRAMKTHANTFEAVLRLSDLALNRVDAQLVVEFRTGDIAIADGSIMTGVEEDEKGAGLLPKQFRLYPNYPNPFNLGTRLTFDVPKHAEISLAIFDVMGRRIRTLVDKKTIAPGTHHAEWDGRTDAGAIAVSGIYFVRLISGPHEQAQKIVLMK